MKRAIVWCLRSLGRQLEDMSPRELVAFNVLTFIMGLAATLALLAAFDVPRGTP